MNGLEIAGHYLSRSGQTMRSFVSAWLCVATLVAVSACASAQDAANLDPVERLFHDQKIAAPASGGTPSIANEEPVSAVLIEESARVATQPTDPRDATPGAGEITLWDAAGTDEGVGAHVANVDTAEQAASGPAPEVNAVPEPSAILLALAALVYFLLFGRRRRMV